MVIKDFERMTMPKKEGHLTFPFYSDKQVKIWMKIQL